MVRCSIFFWLGCQEKKNSLRPRKITKAHQLLWLRKKNVLLSSIVRIIFALIIGNKCQLSNLSLLFNTKIVMRGKLLFTHLIIFVMAPAPENRQPVAVNDFWQIRTSYPAIAFTTALEFTTRRLRPKCDLWKLEWHWACFQTRKTAEEQNANKLIFHIKQVMANVKLPFIYVQKGLFVLCSAFFFSGPY